MERHGDVAVVRVKGNLSGAGGERLERQVEDLVESGPRKVVLNFRETDLVNSVGVSILVGIIERFQEAGKELFFSEMTPMNEEIFSLMGLGEHVRFAGRDDEALTGGRGGEG